MSLEDTVLQCCCLVSGFNNRANAGNTPGLSAPDTHSVDARQLLGKLQHESHDERLAVEGRAEQFNDGNLLLPHHLPALLPHFLHVRAHIRAPSQPLQRYKEQRAERNRVSNANVLFSGSIVNLMIILPSSHVG